MIRQDRLKEYESDYQYKILKKIPVIIKLELKNFNKIFKLSTPFDIKIATLMAQTMLFVVKQIDGVVFAYQYSDKIFLVLRNDQKLDTDPWLGNDIQKISSLSASIATYEMAKHVYQINDESINYPCIFSSQCFGVPNISEVISYLIYRQSICEDDALEAACYKFLIKRFDETLPHVLEYKDKAARKALLSEEGVDFHSMSSAFRLGIGCYQIPSLVETTKGQVTHHKWFLNLDLPIFSGNTDFLKIILTTGSDIFRPERDLNVNRQSDK